MKNQEIKLKSNNNNYSIIIGKNAINVLSKKIKLLCPNVKKIAFIVDKNVPIKFRKNLKKNLKNYNTLLLSFNANEKNKSINTINYFLNILLDHCLLLLNFHLLPNQNRLYSAIL